MFDYGNANESQREAIDSTNGLVLITAGPGTGKTFTLVKRAVYLIQECGVKPEQIMMATFTEKAAKELITRITNELAKRDISVNVNEMYIGTFHSLCLRIIKEHLEYTRLKRNYRLLDTFDQKYLVFRNYYKFKNIDGIDTLFSARGAWKRSDEICNYANHFKYGSKEGAKQSFQSHVSQQLLKYQRPKYYFLNRKAFKSLKTFFLIFNLFFKTTPFK